MALSPLKATRSIPARGESFGRSFQLYSLVSLISSLLVAALIPQLPVDDFPERPAVQEARQVVDEEARDELVALRVRAAEMRQHDDSLGRPEWMLGRKRLLAIDVEHGAGD